MVVMAGHQFENELNRNVPSAAAAALCCMGAHPRNEDYTCTY